MHYKLEIDQPAGNPTKGYPTNMKFGRPGLANMFTFCSMILTTIFSGLIIAKLLAKDRPKHIDREET